MLSLLSRLSPATVLVRSACRRGVARSYSASGGTGDVQSRRRYIPRRAVLYVPGSDERKLSKIPSLGADCVVMDCEDGVAINQKELARERIHATLSSETISFAGKDCSVRVNSVSSGLCQEDLRAALSARRLPDTLHLPKVDTTQELDQFAEYVRQGVGERSLSSPLRVIMFCESGRSLLSLQELCEHGLQLPAHLLLLDGVVFGSDDFCADIGMTRTAEARELLFARQRFVTIVKTYRLQAIDLVYIDYKDLEGLEKQSIEGASFGFTGKQVIHPGQVTAVQRAFSPSPDRVQWATQLLDAFDQQSRQGKGVISFRGAMIDMPLVLQARNILAVANVHALK